MPTIARPFGQNGPEAGWDGDYISPFVRPSPATPQYFIDPQNGTAPNGLPIYNWDEAALQLTRPGASWGFPIGASANVTYSFRSTAPGVMPDDTAGFQRFTAAQIIAAETALQLWADVANITFTRVGTGTTGEAAYSNNATMVFGNYTTGAEGASAFAYYPTFGATAPGQVQGDVWINISLPDNADPFFGGFGLHTMSHEIGHAIGLAHPGEYNAGEGEVITYPESATYWQDSRAYTIMSYFGSGGVGHSLNAFAAGPQLHDIAAAQRLYGANMTTRTGDTIYGFNSNTGRQHYTLTADGQSPVFAIWDAGGIDTLDFSGYSSDTELDLREESFSSAGPGNGGVGNAIGNISIARGAIIENGIGGSGHDVITGNGVANTLVGNGGADIIAGNGGNDIIQGGAHNDNLFGGDGDDQLNGGLGADIIGGGDGFDTVRYDGAAAGVTIYVDAPHANTGDAAGDTLTSIEGFVGSTFNDYMVGGTANNVLQGFGGTDILEGHGGDDLLDGGDGDDALQGGLGGDILDGGNGFDTARYDGAASGVTIYVDAAFANQGEAAGDFHLSIEGIVGSTFGDYLVGGTANNILQGFSGHDILEGHAGNDLLDGGDGNDQMNGGIGGDIFDGGAGFDTVRYDGASAGVIAFMSDAWANTGEAAGDAYISIESLYGSNFNDTLAGASNANELQGFDGVDNIYGYAGTDFLGGGGGDDFLDGGVDADGLQGGAGNDQFIFRANEAEGDNVVDFTGNGASAGDTLLFIGYGTAAGGATFTQLNATQWQITSADGLITDIITLANGATVDASDYAFG